MNKIRAGIVGGAGYAGGELIRILLYHPSVEISFVQSGSNAGNRISKVHYDLVHNTDMEFTNEAGRDADVIFLCKGHGESEKLLENRQIDTNARIIDLSHDFRKTGSRLDLQAQYGHFVYGLPELNRNSIKTSKNIANPGCFATAIQLALIPLADDNKLNAPVHISAITGSTGAGQKQTDTSHFTWRNNNMSVYKPFHHQHLGEIKQSLHQLQDNFNDNILFIPYRGNFTRGIIATVYLQSGLEKKEALNLFGNYYHDEPFVFISPENVHIKQVVNTNFCLLHIEKVEDQLMIISVIDNLVKGASGQAVQNMNIMFGFEETAGLLLKGSAF